VVPVVDPDREEDDMTRALLLRGPATRLRRRIRRNTRLTTPAFA